MASQGLAVITGDIVQSRSYTSKQFEKILFDLERILLSVTVDEAGSYELYRGDSFQVLFYNLPSAIRSAVLISLSLKLNAPHASVRQSIAIGTEDERPEDMRTSLNPLLVDSGLELDKLKKQQLSVKFTHSPHSECVKLIARYLSNELDKVSASQAKALFHYIQAAGELSHGEIAERIGTGRANVTKLLNASNYRLIEDSIQYLTSLCMDV